MLLSVLLFAATCVDRVRPYLKTLFPNRAKAVDRQDGQKAARTSLRIASWNLQFLDLPGRGPDKRVSADYEALRGYARALAADLIAVQEVASPEALALVFPKEEYAYYLAQVGGAQRSGFVFKKQIEVRIHPDLSALSLHDLRAGADLGVFVRGRELRLLSVHLKAFCVTGALTRDDKACRKLSAQLPVLESWIDARAREGAPFVVLGDFNRAIAEPHDALFAELNDGEPAGLVLTQAGTRTHSACHGKRRQAVDHVLLGGETGHWLEPAGLVEVPYEANDLDAGRKLSDHCPIHVTLSAPAMR
jgi:endonuclease/exonuclease/phosphatase family metal-dependent hydrolase